MQCHTIKIVQKLDIYNRFKNDRSNENKSFFVEECISVTVTVTVMF